MNALNGVVSGHLNEGPKNLRSEFSRLVNHTRHTLATYVFLTQVDLHSSSGARTRHDVDRDRFGAGVSMLWPTKIGRSKRGQSQDNTSRLILFHVSMWFPHVSTYVKFAVAMYMLLLSCCRSGFVYGTTVSPAVSSFTRCQVMPLPLRMSFL